jgi:hypothetical protein
MRRWEFLGVIGGGVATRPIAARARQSGEILRMCREPAAKFLGWGFRCR